MTEKPLIAKHGSFEIRQNGTPQTFVVHVPGGHQTRFEIRFVEGQIAHSRDAFALLGYKPHLHLWATKALSQHFATTTPEGQTNEHNAVA